MDEVERIAAGLLPIEKERLIGRYGLPKADWELVTRDLQQEGLIDGLGAFTELGAKVSAHLRNHLGDTNG